ncbi:MAG: nucleotidyltransferase family protein [Chloroflexota bacterium]|nr:nucleotidyltransferase family protein [Chloroflexota bacterium]
MSASAILLAAGESTRMGQLKALLPWQGSTLLQFQVEQLRQTSAAEVLVVLGHEAQTLLPLVTGAPKVQTVLNPHYRLGRSSSIRVAMERVSRETDSVLILGVDQPRPTALLEQLLAAHQKTKALITVPCYRGHRGHPVLFSRPLFPELSRLSEETQGLREVMQRHADQVQELEVPTPLIGLDVNRPADYEEALRLFAAWRQPGSCCFMETKHGI